MKPVPHNLIEQFAEAFCFGRTGFSREEIPQFFATYQGGIPTLHSQYGAAKSQVFINCLAALTPANQRIALYDLCDNPPTVKHPMPTAQSRRDLLHTLLQADGRSPLGVELSSLTLSGIREHWMTAASRIPSSPAAAITAARSLIETTCKTVLIEHNIADNSAGNLSALYKVTRQALGLDPKQGSTQNVHQITSGLTQVIDGLAGLSNKAGDRHGLQSGTKILDISYASLAIHAAGTVALFLARVHKDITRGPTT